MREKLKYGLLASWCANLKMSDVSIFTRALKDLKSNLKGYKVSIFLAKLASLPLMRSLASLSSGANWSWGHKIFSRMRLGGRHFSLQRGNSIDYLFLCDGGDFQPFCQNLVILSQKTSLYKLNTNFPLPYLWRLLQQRGTIVIFWPRNTLIFPELPQKKKCKLD